MTHPRWKHRPPESNRGDFGPDDQLGRLNLITRERRLQRPAKAIEGIAFCLSLPIHLGELWHMAPLAAWPGDYKRSRFR